MWWLSPFEVEFVGAQSQSTIVSQSRPLSPQGLLLATADEVTFRGRADTHAFSKPAANMPPQLTADFLIGDSLFQRLWISSPASVKHADGLGPLFNSRACQSCHIKDGRGHLPSKDDHGLRSVIVKLSMQAAEHQVGQAILSSKPATILPEPVYGFQFHDQAVNGVPAEGHYTVTYTYHRVTLPSSATTIQLKRPRLRFTLNYGAFQRNYATSLRVAPPMIGLGLIEAIAKQDIAQRHDPQDRDGDGISGRMATLHDSSEQKLGRFGWKAAKPSLVAQNLGAFFMDMSMTSYLHPDAFADCTPRQLACRKFMSHLMRTTPLELDVPKSIVAPLLFYTQNLAPPQRQLPSDKRKLAQILTGEQLFYDIGCESCHRTQFTTGTTHELTHLHNQTIFIYSDLLLHDMGVGLDDGYHTPHALSAEWRTPPLWGLGYTQLINPQAGFLHDGRAATITEAILWHGGEAKVAKDKFVKLTSTERAALLVFLESL